MKSRLSYFLISVIIILSVFTGTFIWRNQDHKEAPNIKEKSFKGFESNNSLKIWDGIYQNSLEKNSELIRTLMKTEESSFIIYPIEIRNEIKQQISIMRNDP